MIKSVLKALLLCAGVMLVAIGAAQDPVARWLVVAGCFSLGMYSAAIEN